MLHHEHNRLINTAFKKPQEETDPEFLFKHIRNMHFDKVRKHCLSHKSLDDVIRANDRKNLNCSLAINQVMQATPSQRIGDELFNLLNTVSEYTKRYGENPVKAGVFHYGQRSIKSTIEEMGKEGLAAIIAGVKKILDNYEKNSKDIIIIITWEIDHKRLKAQQINIGCITMDVKVIDISKNETSNCYSFPAHTFKLEDQAGSKDARENFNHFKKYIETNWVPEDDGLKYIKHMGIIADAAVMTKEFKNLLAQDPVMKHFDLTNGSCLHHGVYRISHNTNRDVYHDCDLKFSNLVELKKESQSKRNPFWWDNSYKKDMISSLNHFSAMLSKQNVEGDGRLSFANQVKILIQNVLKKKAEDENYFNRYNSDAIIDGEIRKFFESHQTSKPRMWTVNITNDKKLRKTVHKFEAGLHIIHYMVAISKQEDFHNAFKDTSKKCSVKFIHDLSRYVALQKYIFSLTDCSNDGNNCSILRVVNIALKVTLEDNLDNIWTQ